MSEPGAAPCAVRSATSADLPALAGLAGLSESTRRSLERDLARAEVADTRAPVVLVAVRDHTEVVGAGLGLLQHDEGHVLDLAVAPGHRRLGVGTVLLRALLDELLARGARAVTLEVRAGNLGAQGLYRAEGFTVEGRRPGYYPGGGEGAHGAEATGGSEATGGPGAPVASVASVAPGTPGTPGGPGAEDAVLMWWRPRITAGGTAAPTHHGTRTGG